MESPNFSRHPEHEPAVATVEWAREMHDLANQRGIEAHRQASSEVAAHPELQRMLSQLIEGGPNLPAQSRAILRRKIALRYAFTRLTEEGIAAESDMAFFAQIEGTVQAELDELAAISGSEPLPDLWDIAYQELCQEGEDD